MKKARVTVCVMMAVALTGLLVAHAEPDKGKTTTTSGFLGDYSELKLGDGKDKAQLVYINSETKFSEYTAILMDPITVYANSEKSPLNEVSKEDMQELLNYFDATVRENLKGDYKIVNKPEPGTMRLRIALTEAKGANVAMNAVSSVTPVGLALGGLKKVKTGKNTGVGNTRAEMELQDAQSGERLAAAVDERVGNKLDSFSKWEGAKEAFDFWAGKLKSRLAELRKK